MHVGLPVDLVTELKNQQHQGRSKLGLGCRGPAVRSLSHRPSLPLDPSISYRKIALQTLIPHVYLYIIQTNIFK